MRMDWFAQRQVPLRIFAIALFVVALSALIGLRSSQFTDIGGITVQAVAPLLVVFGILSAFGLAVVDLRLALVFLIVTAGWVDIPLGTGTQSNITTVMLMLPTIGAAWVMQRLVGKRAIPLGDARLNRPVLFFLAGLFTVAVVSLIVNHKDILYPHQTRHHTLEHLPFGFQGIERFSPTLQQGAASLGQLQAFSEL